MSSSASGWTIGAVFGVDVILAPSDEVDQFDAIGFDNRLYVSDLYASIGHERLGTVVVGYADTASDGIDNVNFADSDTLADADVINWNANFLIRPSGEELSDLRWGDFIDGTLAGDTRRIIGYTTPELSVSRALRLPARTTGTSALRYQRRMGRHVRIRRPASAIGRTRWATAPSRWTMPAGAGPLPSDMCRTGLNIAFNVGPRGACGSLRGSRRDRAASARASDLFYYVKGGIVRDFTAWGATSIYGEFYRERKQLNESDEDVLAELERVEGEATRAEDSLATVWGIGVVQKVEAVECRSLSRLPALPSGRRSDRRRRRRRRQGDRRFRRCDGRRGVPLLSVAA